MNNETYQHNLTERLAILMNIRQYIHKDNISYLFIPL